MRKSQTEANVWYVAFVTAVVAKAVDRAADAVWPPYERVNTEQCDCEINKASTQRVERNDAEIARAWEAMQDPVCKPALALLESHLAPAPYRGARRKPQFRLGLSAEQNDPAERALYNLQSFILLIGALLASGALSLTKTLSTLGRSVRDWREALSGIAQLDRRLQLPFDLGKLEELLRAVAVLKTLECSADRHRLIALSLEQACIEISDDGRPIACGLLYNPNDFLVPTAAICIDYVDEQRRPAGHAVVWPTTLGIGARERLEFYSPLPVRSGLTPVGLRLALSMNDFWNTRALTPQGGSDIFELVDELTRLIKR